MYYSKSRGLTTWESRSDHLRRQCSHFALLAGSLPLPVGWVQWVGLPRHCHWTQRDPTWICMCNHTTCNLPPLPTILLQLHVVVVTTWFALLPSTPPYSPTRLISRASKATIPQFHYNFIHLFIFVTTWSVCSPSAPPHSPPGHANKPPRDWSVAEPVSLRPRFLQRSITTIFTIIPWPASQWFFGLGEEGEEVEKGREREGERRGRREEKGEGREMLREEGDTCCVQSCSAIY